MPRSHYPTLSLVSKSFRNLTASSKLYKRRSQLGITQHHVYAVLRNRSTGDFGFYLLHKICKSVVEDLKVDLKAEAEKSDGSGTAATKRKLEDNTVEAIANHCHELQDLDLSKSLKLTDHSLYTLARGCTNLTKLNLSSCTSFSDTGLAYLTRFCKKLKVLNLCGCVEAVSDNALQAIGENRTYGCPDLRTLDLCGCVLITDESVVALANRTSTRCGGRFKFDEEGLRSLNISQCTYLTPSAAQAVCDTFPTLHTCSGRHSYYNIGSLCLHPPGSPHPHSLPSPGSLNQCVSQRGLFLGLMRIK
ncbi:hypothetical protein Bca4012_037754 [Brassica carinata]